MAASLDRSAFFARVRAAPFGGRLTAAQVAGLTALLDACPAGFALAWLAYCLATTFHETAHTMLPIEEYGHGRGRAYGVPAGPWHKVYDGRGDVQLTWYDNYAKATAKLRALGLLTPGEDLARDPDLAMRPDVAAAILFTGTAQGWFTGKKLGDYFGPGRSDPVGARRIINGTDCAQAIAGHHAAFAAALTAAGYGASAPSPPAAATKPAIAAPALAPAARPVAAPSAPVAPAAPAAPAPAGILARLRAAFPLPTAKKA